MLDTAVEYFGGSRYLKTKRGGKNILRRFPPSFRLQAHAFTLRCVVCIVAASGHDDLTREKGSVQVVEGGKEPMYWRILSRSDRVDGAIYNCGDIPLFVVVPGR